MADCHSVGFRVFFPVHYQRCIICIVGVIYVTTSDGNSCSALNFPVFTVKENRSGDRAGLRHSPRVIGCSSQISLFDLTAALCCQQRLFSHLWIVSIDVFVFQHLDYCFMFDCVERFGHNWWNTSNIAENIFSIWWSFDLYESNSLV